MKRTGGGRILFDDGKVPQQWKYRGSDAGSRPKGAATDGFRALLRGAPVRKYRIIGMIG